LYRLSPFASAAASIETGLCSFDAPSGICQPSPAGVWTVEGTIAAPATRLMIMAAARHGMLFKTIDIMACLR